MGDYEVSSQVLDNREHNSDALAKRVSVVRGADLMLEIPMGNIPGYSLVNKFGRNSNVASGTTEEIWDGSVAYTFPTTATITHIRSAVDSATTQGATIEAQGLDANWDLVVQTKALDGTDSTTEVALDTPLIRIFRIKVLDSSVMDEDIWAGATGMSAATANAIVQAGNNQTLMAIYTVPNGKTAYMTSWKAAVNPATNLDPTSNPIRMWARDNVNGYAPQLKDDQGLTVGNIRIPYEPYYKFTQKTDIFFTASPVGKAVDVSVGFDLILVDN